MRRLCRAGRPILARHAPALQWPLRPQLTQAVPTTPRAAAPIAPFARHLCSAHEPQLDPSHMDDEIATGAELEPSAEVLTDAIGLLVEQEAHGVAADSTHDMLLSALLHDTKLHEAVLGYFLAEKSARPSSETYTSTTPSSGIARGSFKSSTRTPYRRSAPSGVASEPSSGCRIKSTASL